MIGRIFIAVFVSIAGFVYGSDSASYYFVFLNANPERPQIEKDSMERLQVAHLENMNRLYGEGKLVVAGPFGDQTAGGIFILKATSLDEANAFLSTDPAVQAKRYQLEVYPFRILHGSMCKAPDPFALSQYPLARIVMQKNLTEENRRQHERYYDELARTHKILFHGSIGSEAVVVFTQDDKIDTAVLLARNDPAVLIAQVRPTVRLWWTATGTFCDSRDE